MRFCSLIFLIALAFTPPLTNSVQAADPDSLQARITIAAMTYDDGFGVVLKNPSGIWFDSSAGELFVADAGNGRVLIYDRELNCHYSFKHYVKDPATGRIITGEPKNLVVNSRGEILLNDAISDEIDLLDFRGRLIAAVSPGRLLGDTTLRIKTASLAVDPTDRFYVLITGDITSILVLDGDLQLVKKIGEKGNLPAQLNTPISIKVFGGKIFVGDLYGTPAVKIYDTSGPFLFGFGGHDINREDLTFPVGFGFIEFGPGERFVLIADGLRQAVKVFNDSGVFFTMIGGFGHDPGQLQYPSGLVSDGGSAFYVVERSGGRIQRYEIR